MTTIQPPADGLFRTITTGATGVDRGGRRILGASVMRLGPLRTGDVRPWDVDDVTLSSLTRLAGLAAEGVKPRFTHPEGDGLGTFLGWWRNFRRVGDRVRADLHISPAATATPKGDLGDYVLRLAEHDPAAFGCSPAFPLDHAEMTRLAANGRKPIRMTILRAIDVVDEPALGDGLFSMAPGGTVPKPRVSWLASNLEALPSPSGANPIVTLGWPSDRTPEERAALAAKLKAENSGHSWLTSNLRSEHA